MTKVLNKKTDIAKYKTEATVLKLCIQNQFFDKNDSWFYDTNLEETKFIKGKESGG